MDNIEKNNINDYENIGLNELIEVIDNDVTNYETSLKIWEQYRYHFKKELADIVKSISSDNTKEQNKENFKEFHLLCSSIENLLEQNNSSLQEFTNNDEELANNDFIKAFFSCEEDGNEFLKDLISFLKEEEKTGKNLLRELENFRKSSDGRIAIKSKNRKNNTEKKFNALLQQLVAEYSSDQRGEILDRIETYIRCGWFDKDEALSKFFNNEVEEWEAVRHLKKMMGEKFFEARVIETNEGIIKSYNLILNPEKTLGYKVFHSAQSGTKDYCILSPDGKNLYFGETTTDETGKINKDNWTTSVISGIEFKKENPDINIHFNVTIVSLFYDIKDKREIKSDFLDLLTNVNQNTIDDLHLFQILSSLNRCSYDCRYDPKEILNLTNVRFIGSGSEKKVNQILKNIEPKDLILRMNKMLKNFKHISIDANGKNTTSVVIETILSSLEGIEALVWHDEKLTKEYCKLQKEVEKFSLKIANAGKLGYQALDLSLKMKNPNQINEKYKLLKKHQEENIIKNEKNKKISLKLSLKQKTEIDSTISKMWNFLYVLDREMKSFYSCQSETWQKNYSSPLEQLKNNVYSIKHSGYVPKVDFSQATIGKQDNQMKKIIFHLIQMTKYMKLKNFETYLLNLEIGLPKLKIIINDIDDETNSMFKFMSGKSYNSNGLTTLGKYYKTLDKKGINELQHINNFKNLMLEQINILLEEASKLDKNRKEIIKNENSQKKPYISRNR